MAIKINIKKLSFTISSFLLTYKSTKNTYYTVRLFYDSKSNSIQVAIFETNLLS